MMVVKTLLFGGPVFQAEGRGSTDAAVRAVAMPLDQQQASPWLEWREWEQRGTEVRDVSVGRGHEASGATVSAELSL